MTSSYHGSKSSRSQQSVLTETAICVVHACQIFSFLFCSFFPTIFAGPRLVEIQKFCYHGNVTQRLLLSIIVDKIKFAVL